MNQKSEEFEKMLEDLINIYENVSSLIDYLPDEIPKELREKAKDALVQDKELKDLIEGLKNHRPPRIFFLGRTGAGKSSLINAMVGSYVATVDDEKSCTSVSTSYNIMDGDRILMEVLDTRGFAESNSLDDSITAEDDLINQVKEFCPDVVLFVLNSTHRDDIIEDICFLKKVSQEYEELNKTKLPIVTVINKSDDVQPSRIKNPKEYPQSKIQSINNIVNIYKCIINDNNLIIDNIIAVSSYIEWMTKDGNPVDANTINNMTSTEIESLKICYDGRYNIDELLHILEFAIQDSEAKMGLRMALRLKDFTHKLANRIIKLFSGISWGVALSPLPASDFPILVFIELILVYIIARLGLRDINIDSVQEFLLSLCGVGCGGLVFRALAQQGSKFLNTIHPVAGSFISALIAKQGTEIIGHAAVSYYIDGKTFDDVSIQIENERTNIDCDNKTEGNA